MSADELEVDGFGGGRVQEGSRQFHVHRKGFPDTEASWEPWANLQGHEKVDEYLARRREQQEREQASERRRKADQQQQQQLLDRSRHVFSDCPPTLRCAPVVPAVTGQRVLISITGDGQPPITAQKFTEPIDFPRRNIPETRFASDRDYKELFQGMDSDHVPIAIIGRRNTADGESEYQVKVGSSTVKPIWVAHDIAVKLCPSLVTRYLFGTVAAKLGLLE